MEEGGENIQGVLQDMTSNEEVGQGEGLTLMSNEVMPRFDLSKLSTKRLIQLRRSFSSHLKNLLLIPRPLKRKHGGKLLKRRFHPSRRVICGH